MRLTYYDFPENISEEIKKEYETENGRLMCSVGFAKKMIKKFGGTAFTEHIDRDGSVFEVTSVELKGNNSKFKYNHHL